jgi:serine protease Do
MDLLNKILVIVSSILLITLVIYVINISQKAQDKHPQEISQLEKDEYFSPDSEKVSSGLDSLTTQPGESNKILPEESKGLMDSIIWKRLPEDSIRENFDGINPQKINQIFAAASKKILKSVVSIESDMLVGAIPDDETHKEFRDEQDPDDPQFFRKGTGSGIIISPTGYILTNYHVVENGDEFQIILYDRREYSGTYIGGDPNTDIALIKIEGKNLPTAYIGNSDNLEIGEWVMAIGNPLNFASTITAGIVSALGRGIRIINQRYSVENFIQTDAVINPGNSGGALTNLNGEVIGVNTAIATRNGFYQGYGFAIPINLAIKIVDDLLAYGEVRRGLLGVSIENVDSRVAKGVGLTKPKGVLVESLEPNYPAKKAGIIEGDVILSVDGEEVNSVNDLQNKIAQRNPNEIVDIKIWRNKKEFIYQIKLGMAPIDQPTQKKKRVKNTKSYKNLGLKLRNLSSREKEEYKTENGIYVESILPGSPAREARILINEVLISINETEIKNVSEFEEILSQFDKGNVVRLKLRRKLFSEDVREHVTFVEIE